MGVDISPQMVEETSKELKNHSNVHLICADAEKLDFPEYIFDTVFCGFGIFFFPNLSQALREIYRVLKPGGQMLFSTWGEDDVCDVIVV